MTDTAFTAAIAPSGWYPDPATRFAERGWDERTGWTAYVRLVAGCDPHQMDPVPEEWKARLAPPVVAPPTPPAFAPDPWGAPAEHPIFTAPPAAPAADPFAAGLTDPFANPGNLPGAPSPFAEMAPAAPSGFGFPTPPVAETPSVREGRLSGLVSEFKAQPRWVKLGAVAALVVIGWAVFLRGGHSGHASQSQKPLNMPTATSVATVPTTAAVSGVQPTPTVPPEMPATAHANTPVAAKPAP